jgi:hypothetical protein
MFYNVCYDGKEYNGDPDEPTILLFETLFCMWDCFSMETELPTKAMLG